MRSKEEQLAVEKLEEPVKGQWWLSYADEETDTFRGVCVVDAHGFIDACMEANRLGIAPGGQTLGYPAQNIPTEFCNRLLAADEASQFC